jgi:hypothetical protein
MIEKILCLYLFCIFYSEKMKLALNGHWFYFRIMTRTSLQKIKQYHTHMHAHVHIHIYCRQKHSTVGDLWSQ